MLQSKLFTKTRKEVPGDETAKNAQLLIKAGFIHKEMAGVYSLLPLGFKVLHNIKNLINEEMKLLGSEEIIMSTLQNKETWTKTDRWSDEKVDIWFKSELKNNTEIGFGWSHEEPITEMMKSHIESYQDLPVYVHQFQNKLRNETRAKSGIMRCREFIMKDMYSYCVDEATHMDFYKKTIESYMNVYRRVGLGDITYITSASGGVFTDKFSHEFQTVCEAGEDIVYIHKEKHLAINEEIFNDETLAKLKERKENFEPKKTAEVGNIFTFGTGKCEEMGLLFTDSNGNKQPVFLGSYGIGVTRLMGVLVEIFSDDRGIMWPEAVAPFQVHLILIEEKGNESLTKEAHKLYEMLTMMGTEVLFDDRNVSAGIKFADADLIGIPYRIVLSKRSMAAGGVEIKRRGEEESKVVPLHQIMEHVSLVIHKKKKEKGEIKSRVAKKATKEVKKRVALKKTITKKKSIVKKKSVKKKISKPKKKARG